MLENMEKAVFEDQGHELLEDEVFVRRMVHHPFIQKELQRYKVFSNAYSDEEDPSRKEEIKQRADEVFGDDPLYRTVARLDRPVQDDDFADYLLENLGKHASQLEALKVADHEGALEEALAKMSVQQEARQHGWDTVGYLEIEFADDGEVVIPHFPRIATDLETTLQRMEESYKLLADLLQHDERFQHVKRIEGMSWLYGQDELAKKFDQSLGWHPFSENEIEEFQRQDTEAFHGAQIAGLALSPKLFQRYLLEGKIPKIGGRWISREEFIEKMKEEPDS